MPLNAAAVAMSSSAAFGTRCAKMFPAPHDGRCLANNQHGRGSDRHDDGNQAQRNNDDLVRVHVAALADLGLLLL